MNLPFALRSTRVMLYVVIMWLCVATVAKAQCGSVNADRWNSKILNDGVAVDAIPHVTSVHDQNELPVWQGPWGKHERIPSETELLALNATLVIAGEEGDNDFHLVLVDGADSMIAEIPSPDDCPEIALHMAEYRKARNDAEALVGRLTGTQLHALSAPVAVTITGYGFYDKKGHGKGHSRNGREIHPVLSIERQHPLQHASVNGLTDSVNSREFTGTIAIESDTAQHRISLNVVCSEPIQGVRIVDTHGTILRELVISEPSNTFISSVPVSRFRPGTYFVHAVTNSGYIARKFRVRE